MSLLLAIDPGKHTGLAFFDWDQLVAAGLIVRDGRYQDYTRQLASIIAQTQPEQAVIELPRSYNWQRQKGDQNDLIDLGVLVGICVSVLSPFCEPDLIVPRQWKGQRDKAVDNRFTLDCLSKKEKEVLNSHKKGKNHNVIDAIGIGLWKLGRR